MLKEFRDFIMRGNVLDLAVGIIIGAAFTTVVNSLVNDILMPPIGVLVGGVDFSELGITLKNASGDDPEVRMGIGLFIKLPDRGCRRLLRYQDVQLGDGPRAPQGRRNAAAAGADRRRTDARDAAADGR